MIKRIVLLVALCASSALASEGGNVRVESRIGFDPETVVYDREGKIVEAYFEVGGYKFERALPTLGDAYDAACRVEVPGARGSGTFVGVSKGKCVVITNFHVVGKKETVSTLQFLGTGDRINIRGSIVARWYNAPNLWDFARIEVEPADMAKTGAKYIPLGGSDCRPAVNSYIVSAGAPKGRFVQAWRGRVIDYYNGSTCLFEPGPVPGQSGSAIVSEIDGQYWVTGILTWLIGTEGADDSKGGAIPISKLYEAARGKKTASEVGAPSPIPPDAKECFLVRASTRTGEQAEAPLEPLAEENDSRSVWEVANKSDAPFVFEFTMANCEPCRKAEKDVEAIRANGIAVYVLNVTTSKDSERRADELRVASFPTFIVFNADGKEVKRFVGADVSARVIEAAQGALPDVAPEPIDEEPIENLPLTNELAREMFDAGDFRNRAAVEQPGDGDFFDESDARWRNRNRNRPEPEPERPAPTTPAPSAPPQIDEARLGDRIAGLLGGRLKDGIADALGNEINGTVDELERRFDKKIEDKIGTLGDKILAKYNAIKWRLFWWFIASVIVSVFFAEVVKSIVAWLWNWTRSKFRTLVNLEARRIAEKATRIAARTGGDAIADIDAGLDDSLDRSEAAK